MTQSAMLRPSIVHLHYETGGGWGVVSIVQWLGPVPAASRGIQDCCIATAKPKTFLLTLCPCQSVKIP